MDLSTNKLINIDFPPEVMWMFLAGIIIIFLIMSFVLQHHWSYYGIKENSKIFAKSLYWIVSVFLIIVMFFSVLYFESL